MAEEKKSKKNLLWIALILGGGIAVYELLKKPNTYVIPPGGSYNGFSNGSNVTVYANAAGQIFTALGKLIGVITGNSGGGNIFTPSSSSSGNVTDTGLGQVVWAPGSGFNPAPSGGDVIVPDASGTGFDPNLNPYPNPFTPDSNTSDGSVIGCNCHQPKSVMKMGSGF